MPKITDEQASRFLALFRGNPMAHYIRRVSGLPFPIPRAITEDDARRHLSGNPPSLLSIPTSKEGLSHFGCIDVDRHADEDQPLDWPALAWKITQLNLPLVVFQSTGGKGAWLFLFLHEPFSSAAVRGQLQTYSERLGITGELFPKQNFIPEGGTGSGVNLPFFGNSRVAFGGTGKELTLPEFLDWAELQRVHGELFEFRGTGGFPRNSYPAIYPWDAVELFEVLLGRAESAVQPGRHAALLIVTSFAARGCLAGIFTEADVKPRIWDIATELFSKDRERLRNLRHELRECWEYGLQHGKLELIFTPADLKAISTIEEVSFHRAMEGHVEDFSSAVAAREFVEQRLSAAGVADPSRLILASKYLTDAIAEEILHELKTKKLEQILFEGMS